MTGHYDELETRTPEARARGIAAQLPALIGAAKAHASHYTTALAGINPRDIVDANALQALPILRKSALVKMQGASAPLGGINSARPSDLLRIFQSPGPIYEAHPRGHDGHRVARALFAAGFRAGDLVLNTYSYHFTPAGHMMEAGATALGCPVFPAGTGQTELQVQAIAHLKPRAYLGTPSFLNILLDKAHEIGADVSSIQCGSVSAEPLPPSLRSSLGERGVPVFQNYGTAELGIIAYETTAIEGLVVNENIVLEIVRPGTGDAVPDGEVGEVVVTVLDNPAVPLIRFATGDLSAFMEGTCPTGRTNRRIRGWMGRADQTAKVRGMFVRPEQVNEVIKRHPEIRRARLVITSANHRDIMTLHCEVASRPDRLQDTIAASLREVCKLRGEVVLLDAGLPGDGKVIDDQRDFK